MRTQRRVSTQRSQRSQRKPILVLFFVSVITAISVFDPSLRAQAALEAIPVRGHIYLIGGAGANITVSAGPDGVFLVDSGTAANADKVLAAIKVLQARLQLAIPPAPRSGA